ncbi:MAG: hypothetical protein ACRCU3_06970 [Eubacteriaceae bacterium]
MAALVGLGKYKTIEKATKVMAKQKKIFNPKKENVEVYNRLNNKVYRRLYKKLKPLYKGM